MNRETRHVALIELLLQGYSVFPSFGGEQFFGLWRPGEPMRLCYPVLLHGENPGSRADLKRLSGEWKHCSCILCFHQRDHLFWLVPIELVTPSQTLTVTKAWEPFKLRRVSEPGLFLDEPEAEPAPSPDAVLRAALELDKQG